MKQQLDLEQPQTMDEALRMLAQVKGENEFIKDQLAHAQTFQARMGLTLNKITIEDLFEKTLLKCRANELTRGRMNSYIYAKKYFLEWCKTSGLIHADEVTRDHTYEWWEHLKTAPFSNIPSPVARIFLPWEPTHTRICLSGS